uniref:riboflavin kinase n=1 Tax=Glossina brevipalpis TaxID=37001 RepID=A0A1A9W8B0_9MUSC
MLNYLPYYASGIVVEGFRRGSEIGIPTANYPLEVVKSLPNCFKTGIYYGWANVDNGPVYKMVMSVGWNPYYSNKEKSMETHILHDFGCDLYGLLLKTCIVGFLRPESNFDSLEKLICAIEEDKNLAEGLLDHESNKSLQYSSFFYDTCKKDKNGKDSVANGST